MTKGNSTDGVAPADPPPGHSIVDTSWSDSARAVHEKNRAAGAAEQKAPSAAMLEAGEKAVHAAFQRYGNELHSGGVVQMLVDAWRAMKAADTSAGVRADAPDECGTCRKALPEGCSTEFQGNADCALTYGVNVGAPAATVREFTNELGNRIRITIEGPTSTSENVLTPKEKEKLREALNAHGAQTVEDRCPSCGIRYGYHLASCAALAHGVPAGDRAQPQEHTASADCWCAPEVDYVDPDTGATVYVHKEQQ